MNRESTSRRAFTLVELLVVIAIIGILVALLLPAIQAAREAARRADCQNRMKQISLACINHHDTKKYFPSAASDEIEKPAQGSGRFTMWGYLPHILPYMEEQAFRDTMVFTQHWDRAVNSKAIHTVLPQLRCPSQTDVEPTYNYPVGQNGTEELTALRAHYQGVMGAKYSCDVSPGFPQITYTMASTPPIPPITIPPPPQCGDGGFGGAASNGVIYPGGKVPIKQVTDGTSHTFMIGEISWLCGPSRVWSVGSASFTILESYNYSSKNVMYPFKTAYRAMGSQPYSGYENNDMSFGSMHPGGTHFALCDGSIQFIRDEVDVVGVLRPMASRKSGDTILNAF